MPRKLKGEPSVADDNAKRPYIIIRDDAHARHAAFDEALSLAQNGHRDQPDVTFLVCRVVATVEPITTPKVTIHGR